MISHIVNNRMNADTSDGRSYENSEDLFMRSNQPYHAERLVRLAEHSQYNKYFLNERCQASWVSTRSCRGKTWEQWLCDVAGIRWYPPLSDPPFYRQTLLLLSTLADAPSIGVDGMTSLYRRLGARATLDDQDDLRVCKDY